METAPAIDGAALACAREAAGLTQHQLARVVGVAGGERISAWEHGRSRPRTPDLLHRVADALGVSPRELLAAPEVPSLRWMRFAAGLSVAEAAVAAHVSVDTFKRWEAVGVRRAVSPRAVESLAAALGADEGDVSAALRGS
ncbi:MAG: helix-turn-helix domain-containing protein [Actinomycetales bacterium]|nr:helix-turn-helix domain-containing protein [Actinomycetales bacterium]